jgi:hypothetical protein
MPARLDYKVVPVPNVGPTHGFDEDAGVLLQKCLDEHAAEGWRFVHVVKHDIVFERPITATTHAEEEDTGD